MAKPSFFRIEDFSGGYNPDRQPSLIADNEATSILNMRLDREGSLLSRSGYSTLLDATTIGFPISLGALTDANSPLNSQLLVRSGTKVYLVQIGSNAYYELANGFGADIGQFYQAQDKAYYCNKNRIPMYYDGLNANALGMSGPISAPTATTNGSGSLSGEYKYAYTYFDSITGAESNPSSLKTVNPSSTAVNLTLITSTNPRVDKIGIYRTTSGGAVLRLLEVIPQATSYTDNGSKALSLSALTYDNDSPPFLEHIAYFGGYYFGSIGDTLYWSKPGQPDAWPALNSTQVTFEGIDSIRALVPHQDALLIFGRSNVLLLNGNSGTWNIVRLDVSIGAVGQDAIADVGGALVFLSTDGLRSYPGMEVIASKIQRELSTLSDAVLKEARLGYIPNERALWLAVNGKTYVVTSPSQAVSIYSISPSFLLPTGASKMEAPVFLLKGQSNIFQYGGENDLGAPIPVKWVSKVFTLPSKDSGLEIVKFFRRIGAYATLGTVGTVTVSIQDRTGLSASVVLESTGEVTTLIWDDFTWDAATWPAAGLGYFLAALPAQTLVGRSITVTISANVLTQTEVAPPITLEYREAARFLGR